MNCKLCGEAESTHKNKMHEYTELTTAEFMRALAKRVGILCKVCNKVHWPFCKEVRE